MITKEVTIINSETKPSIEDIYSLLSNEMLEQAAKLGKEISEDPKEVIEELETKYGKVWAWKYSIFYYYYFKLGSEMLIG
jgi:D-ribose pyranose/furanose isomerase RbsD